MKKARVSNLERRDLARGSGPQVAFRSVEPRAARPGISASQDRLRRRVTVENPPSEGGLKVSDIETPVSRNAERRFPPPWPGEETEACFIVSDANGQALA